MTTHVNITEKTHKLFELIEYYEVCNRAEGKSPKTISWYSANLRSFRNYMNNRHLSDSLDNIDTKLLREYVLYMLKKTRYENHRTSPIIFESLNRVIRKAKNYVLFELRILKYHVTVSSTNKIRRIVKAFQTFHTTLSFRAC